MRLSGHVYKDGSWWLAEVPILEAMTQGKTRKEALAMVKDLLETMAEMDDFSVTVHLGEGGRIELEADDPSKLVALLLKRKRQLGGLSLAEVARNLGARSRNAYARYERGEATPSLTKLSELIKAVSPGNDLVITGSTTR